MTLQIECLIELHNTGMLVQNLSCLTHELICDTSPFDGNVLFASCRPEGKDYALHRLILGTHT